MATSKKSAPKKETKTKASMKTRAPKKAGNVTAEAEQKLAETEVIVVLDRSGSMRSIANATVTGVQFVYSGTKIG